MGPLMGSAARLSRARYDGGVTSYLEVLESERSLFRAELAESPSNPLSKGRWAGAVDSVGGSTLTNIIAHTIRHGCIAACGLAGGYELNTTVFPFILRGVVLYGIDSNPADPEKREAAWARLADAVRGGAFSGVDETVSLADVIPYSDQIVRGETRGRVIVDVRV